MLQSLAAPPPRVPVQGPAQEEDEKAEMKEGEAGRWTPAG